MRWRLRLVTSTVLGVALAASAAGATGVDARATLERAGGPPVAGQEFRVVAGIEAEGQPPPFSYTQTVTLSPGLKLVKVSRGFSAPQCNVAGSTVTCRATVIGGSVNADSHRFDLRAEAGTHTVRTGITLDDQTDPNTANDSTELSVVVGAAALSASSVRLSPSQPRAGRQFQATVVLARAGAPVRPDRASCAATVAGKPLAGRSARLANGARCLWLLPASAKGKRIAGSISATAGGKTLTRRFAVVAR